MKDLQELGLVNIFLNPAPAYFTANGIKYERTDRKGTDEHFFSEISINDTNLPLCDSQNDGLIKNNEILPKSKNFQLSKQDPEFARVFKHKRILLLDGDSTTRIIHKVFREKLSNICQQYTNSSLVLEGSTTFFESMRHCKGPEAWTLPSKLTCLGLNITLIMTTHAGPPLSNSNCGLAISGGFLIKSLQNLISGDGSTSHVVFGPAYHYNSENLDVFAREWYGILEESSKVKLEKPKTTFYAKLPHWWAQVSLNARLQTPYVNYKMIKVVKKLLHDSFFEFFDPWNQLVARNKIQSDDVHPLHKEEALFVDLFIDKLLSNFEE